MNLAMIAAALPLAWPVASFVRQDMRRWRVYDATLILILIASAGTIYLQWLFGMGWERGLAGAGLFLGTAAFIKVASGLITGRDAFGTADVVLAVAAGACLGWQMWGAFWILAACFGMLTHAWLTAKRRKRGKRPFRHVPFGPGMAWAMGATLIAAASGLYAGYPFSALGIGA